MLYCIKFPEQNMLIDMYFRPTGDMDEISISEIPTISKIDNIKEDFAKVLTDWQEHIGYLQVSTSILRLLFIIYRMNLHNLFLGHWYGWIHGCNRIKHEYYW